MFKIYCIFWGTQSLSLLGSAMTNFALSLWIFQKTNSAFALSLLLFCWFLPWILLSVFVGGFVDSHNKKNILLISDFISVMTTLFILILINQYSFNIVWIYIANIISGASAAFQSPAQDTVVGILVSKDKYGRISGMQSFSTNLVSVLSPIIAAALYSWKGLYLIFLIDFMTFLFAFIALLFFIKIPEKNLKKDKKITLMLTIKNHIIDSKDGFRWIRKHKGILNMMISMAIMNFFSKLTYENILAPMILARSGGDNQVLGVVTSIIGVSGIIGGIFVTFKKKWRNNTRIIFIAAAISFLFGDISMAIGKNINIWILGGIFASFPFPFVTAGQNNILYSKIPFNLRGRVFAARNAIQYSLIPIGLLTGGWLADNVFEKLMLSKNKLSLIFIPIVGKGHGSGMAIMFLFTGIIGFLISILMLKNKKLKNLSKDVDIILEKVE